MVNILSEATSTASEVYVNSKCMKDSVVNILPAGINEINESAHMPPQRRYNMPHR